MRTGATTPTPTAAQAAVNGNFVRGLPVTAPSGSWMARRAAGARLLGGLGLAGAGLAGDEHGLRFLLVQESAVGTVGDGEDVRRHRAEFLTYAEESTLV